MECHSSSRALSQLLVSVHAAHSEVAIIRPTVARCAAYDSKHAAWNGARLDRLGVEPRLRVKHVGAGTGNSERGLHAVSSLSNKISTGYDMDCS